MRRTAIFALALLPAVLATWPAAASSWSAPRGRVIVRPECYGAPDIESRSSSGRMGAQGYGMGGGGSAAGRAMPGQKSSAGKSSPPVSRAPAPSPVAEAAPSGILSPNAPAPMDVAEDSFTGDIEFGLPIRDEVVQIPSRQERREAQRTLDWGATVHLSNDDSMSLASAQRVLYAAMNGLRVPLQEIRPHELLNYFSFDTVTPDADQVFDVLASAEQHGDELSVALSVKGAVPERQPLDVTLLVDRSCSMEAEGRMSYTKRGLTRMAEQLTSGDRVDLVLFDDGVCVPLQNFVVGRDDPRLLAQAIDAMAPEGSTDLDLGLRKAYEIAKSHQDTQGRNRRVMILTDALLNTGDVNPDTVSEIGRAFDNDGIRVTGVGVGREFNDDVLDMLTEKGKGAYVYLGSEAVVDRLFGPTGFDSLVQTIAHDVRFALHLPDSLAMERFYGEESSTDPEDVQPINYYAGTSQLFLQDLKVRDGRIVPNDPVRFEVNFKDARTSATERRVFRTTVGRMLAADPHNVRKARALIAWADLLTADAFSADPCGRDLQAYAGRASQVSDDAEIAFVNGLVQKRCGAFHLADHVVTPQTVPFKIKVDADVGIGQVTLDCDGGSWSESLTGSDTVARFDAYPGTCQLTLAGPVDLRTRVTVPATGGDLRCVIRGGRLRCT